MKRRRIWIVAAVLLLAGAGFAAYRHMHPRRNIVLIVVDALRADRLSCYGYRAHSTPNIDRLAARGTLFENAFSHLPMTQPSFAAIFTSLHPYSHGVRFNDNAALSPSAVTLAEILRKNGMQPAAVVGASNLDSVFGLHQGFELYEDNLQLYEGGQEKAIGRTARWERNAAEVNEKATLWLQERDANRNFFLMIHYFDPHDPYDPPEKFRAADNSKPALYDGEVRYVDSMVGELMTALERKGLLNNTLVLLTADHGESLGEHQIMGHKWAVYDGMLKVPFIMAGPGIPAGGRIPALVQHIDIAPTILDYTGIERPSFYQGKSVMELIHGEKKIHDFVIMEKAVPPKKAYESTPAWRKFPYEQWALRTETEKVICTPGETPMYFDLKSDPGEEKDIFTSHQQRAQELCRTGEQYRSKLPQYKMASHPGKKKGDADAEEILRALGYLN